MIKRPERCEIDQSQKLLLYFLCYRRGANLELITKGKLEPELDLRDSDPPKEVCIKL